MIDNVTRNLVMYQYFLEKISKAMVKLKILVLLKTLENKDELIHRLINKIIHFTQFLWKGIELGRMVSDGS